MATVSIRFHPRSGIPAATNGASQQTREGTNFPIPVLRFDGATQQTAYFYFPAVNYGSGNLTLTIYWYAETGTTGNVVWEAAIAAITPNTDTQDVETKAFATINYVQDTHLETTGKRLHSCAITISNLDSLAANDWVVLSVARDADSTNATDDVSGYADIADMILSYSDT
jgi:hypothetical protein